MIIKLISALVTAIVGGFVFNNLTSNIVSSLEYQNATSAAINSLMITSTYFNGYVFGGMLLFGTIISLFAEYKDYEEKGEDIVMTKSNPQPHRQTYAEYVKERLYVEEMLR